MVDSASLADFFFQADDGIRDIGVTGVQTCALPIYHAIALALGGAGARVIGTSTSAEGAARLSAALASHGCNGRGAVLDAGNAASVDALVGELEAASELPTILVNNAAITRDTLLVRMKPEDWDAVIAT